MTALQPLTDKRRIEALLRRNPELHVYGLGDLDDFFWPYTTWYGREADGALTDIVLVYTARALPTVVGIADRPETLRELLRAVTPLLPRRFYAHLSPGVEQVFERTHRLEPHGPHYKMAWRDAGRITGLDCTRATPLTRQDLDDLGRLYQESYLGNWFDARMLETGQYFGLRVEDRLVSAAGVHVYSERYRVAAIGNVVTHPDHRNRGYARLVTARLCQSLRAKVDHVGLHVKTDNEPALACYRRLGFEIIASYGEFLVEEVSTPEGGNSCRRPGEPARHR
jgi:ribosomal protein S18 acetylase RimI-like enzyme